MTNPILFGVMAGGVASLLYGIRTEHRVLETLSKVVASSCFVLLGWLRFSEGSSVDTWIVVGLVLCAAGDILLIFDRSFDLGLLSFLSGHVAYVVAFAAAAGIAGWPLLPLAPLAIIGLVTGRWLWPHLGHRRLSVTAYIVVISVMVWGAVAVAIKDALPWTIALGALLFYISDLAVARHRFIKTEFLNRALGLPAYYAGQFLIALSI
jgi:uncharacterized membrane protein YhhN